MKLYDGVKSMIITDFIKSDDFTNELLTSIHDYGISHKEVVKANYVNRCFCGRFAQVYNFCKEHDIQTSQEDLDIVLKAMTTDVDVNDAISNYIDELYKENDIDEQPIEYIKNNEKIVLSTYGEENRLERFVKIGDTYVMINCICRGTREDCKQRLKIIGEE